MITVSNRKYVYLVKPNWHLCLPCLQATGREFDTFVSNHQDKSRNALNKAVEASFIAWVEELRADQAQFTSEKITFLDFISHYIVSNFWASDEILLDEVLLISGIWGYGGICWLDLVDDLDLKQGDLDLMMPAGLSGWRKKVKKLAPSWSASLRRFMVVLKPCN